MKPIENNKIVVAAQKAPQTVTILQAATASCLVCFLCLSFGTFTVTGTLGAPSSSSSASTSTTTSGKKETGETVLLNTGKIFQTPKNLLRQAVKHWLTKCHSKSRYHILAKANLKGNQQTEDKFPKKDKGQEKRPPPATTEATTTAEVSLPLTLTFFYLLPVFFFCLSYKKGNNKSQQ